MSGYDRVRFEQGRLRAIVALQRKPDGKAPWEWLTDPLNLPISSDHPDFIAGYASVLTSVTPA